MALALVLLGVLALAFIGVLPIWSFSGDWGYGPAIVVAIVLLIPAVMPVVGQVPGAITH